MLFTDYRTTNNKSMLAKHSHLLPIQQSRASSLLPLARRSDDRRLAGMNGHVAEMVMAEAAHGELVSQSSTCRYASYR